MYLRRCCSGFRILEFVFFFWAIPSFQFLSQAAHTCPNGSFADAQGFGDFRVRKVLEMHEQNCLIDLVQRGQKTLQ